MGIFRVDKNLANGETNKRDTTMAILYFFSGGHQLGF